MSVVPILATGLPIAAVANPDQNGVFGAIDIRERQDHPCREYIGAMRRAPSWCPK